MVKVEYFLGEKGKNLTGWVPVAVPYSGNDFGYYALPEVGSEVILAFQMGDRNCPIVIGTVWSNKNAIPKETANEKNTIKKLKTKGGCEITFSEEAGKEQIQIKTPKELQIVIEDEKQTIKISDKDTKNGITIDAQNGKISFVADKTMEFKVGGNPMITLNGQSKAVEIKGGKITANADQSIEAKGTSVKLEASASMEIKGNSTLKAESSGVTQVKGSMVQIN